MKIEALNSHLILTSGDNVVTFDTVSGTSQSAKIPPPSLPPNLTRGQLEVLNKEERTITSIATSRNGHYIAVSTENKQIVVYDNNLNMKKNFIVNRVASKILFTNSGDILVADRTGDVFLYKFNDENAEPMLLLGHLSMILDMVLSECGKYIITCDRDEKIRVSHFPNTYNIVSFCLGHEEFVTTIKIVKNVLVSASGDGTVRIWNYLRGEQLNVVNTNQYVSNAKLLERFSQEMDKEKVDVTALPITDMQVYCSDVVLVAVALLSYSSIQLYKITLNNSHCDYLTSIDAEIPFKFYLNLNLYIFDNIKLTLYKFLNNDCCIDSIQSKIEDFYQKYKVVLKIVDSNSITVLYKRKFDNVQEYLERKKLRLESRK